MYRAFMSHTLSFSDTVQVTDSTQVMMCKLVLRVPHCQQQNGKMGPIDTPGSQVILPLTQTK